MKAEQILVVVVPIILYHSRETNLEVLPLRYFSKGLVQFLFIKSFVKKNYVLSDDKKQCSIKHFFEHLEYIRYSFSKSCNFIAIYYNTTDIKLYAVKYNKLCSLNKPHVCIQTLKWEKTLKDLIYMSQNHQVHLRCHEKHSDLEQKNRKQKDNKQKQINNK